MIGFLIMAAPSSYDAFFTMIPFRSPPVLPLAVFFGVLTAALLRWLERKDQSRDVTDQPHFNSSVAMLGIFIQRKSVFGNQGKTGIWSNTVQADQQRLIYQKILPFAALSRQC